jgi:hypothetical protein
MGPPTNNREGSYGCPLGLTHSVRAVTDISTARSLGSLSLDPPTDAAEMSAEQLEPIRPPMEKVSYCADRSDDC